MLSAAEDAGFPVIVTVGRNMQFQQSMEVRQISVIYLRVPKNDLANLARTVELLEAQLDYLKPGSTSTIYHPNWR